MIEYTNNCVTSMMDYKENHSKYSVLGLYKAEETNFSDFIYTNCIDEDFDYSLNKYTDNPMKLISLRDNEKTFNEQNKLISWDLLLKNNY